MAPLKPRKPGSPGAAKKPSATPPTPPSPPCPHPSYEREYTRSGKFSYSEKDYLCERCGKTLSDEEMEEIDRRKKDSE